MNRLGPFLLFARFEKNWSWRVDSPKPGTRETYPEGSWENELVTKGNAVFKLPAIATKQPVRINGTLHAFTYMKLVEPDLAFLSSEEITFHDAQEFLQNG